MWRQQSRALYAPIGCDTSRPPTRVFLYSSDGPGPMRAALERGLLHGMAAKTHIACQTRENTGGVTQYD